MPHIALTANVAVADATGLHLGPDETGFTARLPAADSLGGGTLTLYTRDATETAAVAKSIGTLAVGDANEYRTGGNTVVTFALTGATAPSATLILQKIR
jgi:hypothetical protein